MDSLPPSTEDPLGDQDADREPFRLFMDLSLPTSLLEKYHVPPSAPGNTGGNMWEHLKSAQSQIVIDKADLLVFVQTVEFFFHRRHVCLESANGTTKRFHCSRFPHCDWAMVLTRPQQSETFPLPKDCPKHSLMCHATQEIPNLPVMRNHPVLVNWFINKYRFGETPSYNEFEETMRHCGLLFPHDKTKNATKIWVSRLTTDLAMIARMQVACDHSKIADLLLRYKAANPSATVALQVDTEGRFLRMYASIPHAKEIFENYCLPVMFLNGNFAKPYHVYDGVLFLCCSQDGNGSNIPLSIAWIPAASCVHLCWFTQLNLSSGLPMQDVPTFVDGGHILSAAAVLANKHRVFLNLKYSIEHIVGSMVGRFLLDTTGESTLRGHLTSIQQSTQFQLFVANVRSLAAIFEVHGAEMCLYVLSIHPVHWVVFANRQGEEYAVETWWKSYVNLVLEMLQ